MKGEGIAIKNLELAVIRERRSLDASWPEEQDIETLVRLSIPFFVFAATICRFLGEDCHNPRRQLADILRYETEDIPKQDATYLPILNHLFLNHLFSNQSERGREKISQEFREVVGPIVVLRSPLSVIALANLLDVAVEDVRCRLDSLHSVLYIPSDEKQPIRLLHLSFRDFLVDPEKRGRSPFWIDEQETNGMIARKCLELLSGQNGLRQNICNLSRPGDPVPEVGNQMVNASLSSELQYACHYWVSHIRQSKRNISDHSLILRFLLDHALHWLEVASIMGDVSGTIIAIKNLLSYANESGSAELSALTQDIRRFCVWIRPILDIAPLQHYLSASLFAPVNGPMRKRHNGCGLPSIRLLSKPWEDWDALHRRVDGHSDAIDFVAFSSDGRLASSSYDKTIKIWDTTNGSLQRTLEGHSARIGGVTFSPRGQIASGSHDMTARLWTATGCLQWTLRSHSRAVISVAFSPSGELLASGSYDKTIKLWDSATGKLRRTLEGHSRGIRVVVFSPEGWLASGSLDQIIKLWDTTTGNMLRTLQGHPDWIFSLAFSPDGTQLASSSDDTIVMLWDTTTWNLKQTLDGHSRAVNTVAFSPDGKQLASSSRDQTIKLWDIATGSLDRTIEGHSAGIGQVCFSPDGRQLASCSADKTIKVWDPATGSLQRTMMGHFPSTGKIVSVTFSPDGGQVESRSIDGTIKLCEVGTGSPQRGSEDGNYLPAVTADNAGQASPDSRHLIVMTTEFKLANNRAGEGEGQEGETTEYTSHSAFVIDNEWISRDNGERVLWLPFEYRATCLDVRGNRLALGHLSGKVTVLEIGP